MIGTTISLLDRLVSSPTQVKFSLAGDYLVLACDFKNKNESYWYYMIKTIFCQGFDILFGMKKKPIG
jgi:hypothetical protein